MTFPFPPASGRSGQTGLTDPFRFHPREARHLLALAAASTRVSTITPTGEFTLNASQVAAMVTVVELAGALAWRRLTPGQQAVLKARKVVSGAD